jgi:glycine hydroxymethyltransferase
VLPPRSPPPQGGPHNHQIGALAVALKYAATEEFVTYQKQVGAGRGRTGSAAQGA